MECDFELGDAGVEVYTAAERPDLWEQARPLFGEVWPEYNLHGNHTSTYFGALFPRFANLQALFLEPTTGRVIARGRTIPFCWDGTLADLPAGIDAVGLQALEETAQPNAVSALAAEVAEDRQGRGLSALVLQAMGAMARAAGLGPLVAPVRPTIKDRYPVIPIQQYAQWTRPDGLPFDPWMRVHARLGAKVLRSEPQSLKIEAPVTDWESWICLQLPADGDYVFTGGLAPLTVKDGVGLYFEPNVWMLHELR